MKVQLSRKRLQEHVVELARAFEVELHQAPEITVYMARNISGRQKGAGRVVNIVIAPIATDETTYACCLHELGHAVHPAGQLRQGVNGYDAADQNSLKLDEEHYAWEWAKHHALVWTKKMQEAREFAYGSHVRGVERDRAMDDMVKNMEEILQSLKEPSPYKPSGSPTDFINDILLGRRKL